MEWWNEIYSNGPGHMTNMAVMPILAQNLKKSSSLDDLEIRYAASGA